MHPTKRHDGKLLTIINSMDEIATGKYRHINKSSMFTFYDENGRIPLLARDEWLIVHVWSCKPDEYSKVFANDRQRISRGMETVGN